MLRLLAIIVIVFLILRTIGTVFRFLAGGSGMMGSQNQRYQGDHSRKKRPSDGNVNIDYVPKGGKKKSGFKGGEYVDYEDLS